MKEKWKAFLLLVLVFALTLPMVVASASGNPDSIGAKAAQSAENLTLEAMLTYALQDEYLAKDLYAGTLEKFGPRRPFSNIIQAEENHIAMLKPLFTKYNAPLPAEQYHSTGPDTIKEALQISKKAEEENIAMYDLFLKQNLPADVHEVFTALRNASQNHLSAFERNLEGSNSQHK